MTEVMKQYEKRQFETVIRGGETISHDVYEQGDGPPIILIQELPGIGQETLYLADRFVAQGFRIIIPHLFGPLGKISMLGNLVRVFCLKKEFSLFSRNSSSPVSDWLRALCRDVRDQSGVRGVGVIGMCLTGNFAISLMADDSVLAAVASQPSMPLMRKHDLHMSDEELTGARLRLDREGPMLAYRFAGDRICSKEKFDAIDKCFNNDDTVRVKLNNLPGKGHSVLTLDFVDEVGHPTSEALDTILRYFKDKLQVT